jgi:lipopolysaccharide biosynthesis regulator YciM
MFAESALTPLPLATEEPEYVETEEEKVPEVSVSEELTGARGLFGKKDFTKALDVVLALRKIEPENQDVWLLENDIYCDYARQRAGENDFAGAEEIIGQADIKQPCVKETFSFLKKRRVGESQRLYLQGVNHYVNENLQAAINSWKNALAINPEHAKAQADMRKAQNLLERLNKLK